MLWATPFRTLKRGMRQEYRIAAAPVLPANRKLDPRPHRRLGNFRFADNTSASRSMSALACSRQLTAIGTVSNHRLNLPRALNTCWMYMEGICMAKLIYM